MTTVIFGLGDVVRSKYIPVMSSDMISSTVFVEKYPQNDTQYQTLQWDSEALTNLINSDTTNSIVIATDPNSHGKILHYLAMKLTTDHSTIYVEKPFLTSTVEYSDLSDELNRDKWKNRIYGIDHYLEKPVVKWLKINLPSLVDTYGTVESFHFTSFEKKGFSSYETFKCGYPIEHGVHAIAIFDSLFLSEGEQTPTFKTLNKNIEHHVFPEGPIANKFSYHFSLDQFSNAEQTLLNSKTSIFIDGGKHQPEDRKTIELNFGSANVICGINDGSIHINNKYVRTIEGEDPYQVILKAIHEGEPCDGIVSASSAMRAVQLMQ